MEHRGNRSGPHPDPRTPQKGMGAPTTTTFLLLSLRFISNPIRFSFQFTAVAQRTNSLGLETASTPIMLDLGSQNGPSTSQNGVLFGSIGLDSWIMDVGLGKVPRGPPSTPLGPSGLGPSITSFLHECFKRKTDRPEAAGKTSEETLASAKWCL